MSLDGVDRAAHDSFRGVEGSFDAVLKGAAILREAGLPFQINTTVTRLNVEDLDGIYGLVRSIRGRGMACLSAGACRAGRRLKGEELTTRMYESTLEDLYEIEKKDEIELKVTCAPHYYRIVKEKGGTPKSTAASRERASCSFLTGAWPSHAATSKRPRETCVSRA